MNNINIFQVDSKIVQDCYNNADNYIIEYDKTCEVKNSCTVYFSSHDIYFPNNENTFRKRIIEKNIFEWYGLRKKSYKHIFVRDVFKQWFLAGINKKINSPEKLSKFLANECNDYNTTMIGSSAGGYAAILFGSILNVNRVIAFNSQFEIKSLLDETSEEVNPLVFRLKNHPESKYFNIIPYINSTAKIYYFYSCQSSWDAKQNEFSANIIGITRIAFKTSHHGIPFLKIALNKIFESDDEMLISLSKRKLNPIIFTIKMVGLKKTISGLISQIIYRYKKRR